MEWSDLRMTLWSWLLVPLTALDWWIAWSRLPERVVMKTGPSGQPTSWAAREQAMTFDLGLLAGVLAFTTVLTMVVAFAQQSGPRVSPSAPRHATHSSSWC